MEVLLKVCFFFFFALMVSFAWVIEKLRDLSWFLWLKSSRDSLKTKFRGVAVRIAVRLQNYVILHYFYLWTDLTFPAQTDSRCISLHRVRYVSFHEQIVLICKRLKRYLCTPAFDYIAENYAFIETNLP